MSKRVTLALRLPGEYSKPIVSGILRDVEGEFDRLSTFANTFTWNPADIANGAQTSTTATVTGVSAGILANVRVFAPYTLSGLIAWGYVSADNTVTVALANTTGSNVNLGSGTWGVIVESFGPTS